jgi:Tol biopolymer transport system component
MLLLLGLAGLGLGGATAARSLASAAAPAGSTSSGTGAQILFSRAAHDFAPPSLYLMDSDGTNVRLFVSNAGAASVSRDRRRIAFVRAGEIWAMQRDGSAQHRVTTPQSGWVDAGDPTWSPDGRTLYFSLSTKPYEDHSAIFSVHTDGTGLRRLTRLRCDYGPTVSADGRFVAFGRILGDCIHGADGAVRAITTAPATLIRRLPFRFPLLWLYDPAWSPDGRQLAYVSLCDLSSTPPTVGCYGLFVSALDGSRPRRLLWRSFQEFGYINGPAWSPDGTQLAFEVDEGTGDIWLIRADGTQLRRLTRTKAVDSDPVWLPAQTSP